MNGLEKAVRPIIIPMIQGRRRALGAFEQVAITMWVLKTAMVAEFLRGGLRYFTQRERSRLMKATGPPLELGARVWVGRYGDKNRGFHALTGTLMHGPGVIGAHTSAFALGEFLVQVFVERETARYVGELFSRPGPWKDTLIQIWPPDLEMVAGGAAWIWPPRLALNNQGFNALFDRFLSLSGQRGPYLPSEQS